MSELKPNTPITQENVALLKAGDWTRTHSGDLGQFIAEMPNMFAGAYLARFRDGEFITGAGCTYIGPDLGDGWIGWGGGDCPVDGEASIDWQQRWVKGVYSGPAKLAPWKVVSAFRPALAKPAEGADPYGPLDNSAIFATPTPQSVDWERVGPKLVEALRPLARLEVPVRSVGNAGAYSILHSDIRRAAEALAATQPQSNGD